MIFVPECQAKSSRRVLCSHAAPRFVRATVASRYVEELCDIRMCRESAAGLRACHKAEGTSLKNIWSLAEQRNVVQNVGNKRTNDVSEVIVDEKEN